MFQFSYPSVLLKREKQQAYLSTKVIFLPVIYPTKPLTQTCSTSLYGPASLLSCNIIIYQILFLSLTLVSKQIARKKTGC